MDLLIEAVENPAYEGVYNGTAPNPVRMSELCSSLGAAQLSLGLLGVGLNRYSEPRTRIFSLGAFKIQRTTTA